MIVIVISLAWYPRVLGFAAWIGMFVPVEKSSAESAFLPGVNGQ